MPGVPRGGLLRKPAGERFEVGWAEHKKDHPKRARRVQPEWHRGHIRAAAPPSEPKRHPGEEQITHHHPNRSPGHQMPEGKLGGVLKDRRQQTDGEHQVGEIVERQAEERIHVTGHGPLVSLALQHLLQRTPATRSPLGASPRTARHFRGPSLHQSTSSNKRLPLRQPPALCRERPGRAFCAVFRLYSVASENSLPREFLPNEPFSIRLRNKGESVHDLPAQSGRNEPTQEEGGSAWQASSVESADPTDEVLLQQFCEEGDEHAFEALVRRYEQELFNYLRRYLGQAEMAEDVFQATFLQIYLKKEQFQQGRRFRPWLYTIATNQAIDAQRRNKRHRMISLDNRRGDDDVAALVEVLAGNDPTAAQRYEQEEAKEWVRAAVDDLPDQLKATLLLVYHQGLKYREAADALGIPVGTVKSRLHSALLKLNESGGPQCGT